MDGDKRQVYDVTEYLERGRHLGGEDVMMEYPGYDANMAFRGVGHSRGSPRCCRNMWWGFCHEMRGLDLRLILLKV